MVSKHLSYLRYVVKHKWCTLIECAKLGILWRGIVHDLSKFSKAEWSPYVERFYGKRITGIIQPIKLKRGSIVRYTGGYNIELDESGKHVVVDCSKGTTMQVCDGGTGCRDVSDDYYYIQLLPLAAKQAFDIALNHHHKRNKHHWPYWVLAVYDSDDSVNLEMPEKYLLEMIADWRGASRAQGLNNTTDVVEWYMKRRERFKKVLHEKTRTKIDMYLGVWPDDSERFQYEITHSEESGDTVSGRIVNRTSVDTYDIPEELKGSFHLGTVGVEE